MGGRSKGYGHFWLNQKTVKAHHIAYVLATNTQVSNCILHSCDNPGCVNPNHLSEGTIEENNRQRSERGRSVNNFQVQSKLKLSEVEEIRGHKGNHTKIAHLFGVHPSTVSRIKAGKTW